MSDPRLVGTLALDTPHFDSKPRLYLLMVDEKWSDFQPYCNRRDRVVIVLDIVE